MQHVGRGAVVHETGYNIPGNPPRSRSQTFDNILHTQALNASPIKPKPQIPRSCKAALVPDLVSVNSALACFAAGRRRSVGTSWGTPML